MLFYVYYPLHIHSFSKSIFLPSTRDSRSTDDIIYYTWNEVYTRQLLYIFWHRTRFVFNHTGLLCYIQQCQSLLKVTSLVFNIPSDFSEINLVIFCYDFYIIFILWVLNLSFIFVLNFSVSEKSFVIQIDKTIYGLNSGPNTDPCGRPYIESMYCLFRRSYYNL